MPCRHSEVEILLQKLKKQMIIARVWSSVTPSNNALSSRVPFAWDQMTFEQWLQFIFIPKMTKIVRSKNNLPVSLSLTPMAELSFKGQPHLDGVMASVVEIDNIFAKSARN